MHTSYIVILTLTAALFTWAATWGVRQAMLYFAVLDLPEERRNHTLPTPRGAGIAVTFFATLFLVVASADFRFLGIALLLSLLSFYDDVKHLSVRTRLLVQTLLVTWMMLGFDGHVFQEMVPLWADKILSGLLLLAFMNIYNFMDGIDEITTAETLGMTFGITFVYLLSDLHIGILADAWIISGAVLGFWYWNRHPAKIFLGDSGSIPLGFLMGVLMLILASRGFWAAALILPAYYWTDGLLTIARRVLRRERIWQAHSQHAYQMAVRSGWSHRDVSAHVMVLNLLLSVIAGMTAIGSGLTWAMIGAAYLLSLMLYLYFHSAKPSSGAVHATPAA